MRQRLVRLAFVPLLAAGCGSPPASPDGGALDDGGRDLLPLPDLTTPADMAEPKPPALPQLYKNSGTVLTDVNMVTVTFDGYPYRGAAEAFGEFVFGSKWFPAVTAEYGIKSGTHVEAVRLADKLDATMTDAQIAMLIEKHIQDGSLPAPSGRNFYYMVYFPSGTTISDGGSGGVSGASCSSFLGYHSEAKYMGTPFAYGVICDCDDNQDTITVTAAHELVEAATDPYPYTNPGYNLQPDPGDPWQIEIGQESADLCDAEGTIYENGVALQRIWSNAAAAEGTSPCVPMPDPDYAAVFPVPYDIPTASAGDTVTFTLMGWTAGNAQSWDLTIGQASYVDYTPTEQQARLSATTISPGDTVTLTMTVPRDADQHSGSIEGVLIESTKFAHVWPVAYQIQ